MNLLEKPVARRLTAWVTIAIALAGTAMTFALVTAPASDTFPASGLAADVESARVSALLDDGPSADATVAILLFDRDGGAVTDADLAAVNAAAARLAELSTVPQAVRPLPSDDGRAVLVAVPLSKSGVEGDVAQAADELAVGGTRGPARRTPRPPHRTGRVPGRHLGRVRRCRLPAAAGHRHRRRCPADHHLPQPGALDRAAGRRRCRGRPGAGRRRRARARPRLHHRSVGGRHPVGARFRRRNQLRPPAGRPLPGRTDPRAGPLRGDAHGGPRCRSRHPGQRRNRRPSSLLLLAARQPRRDPRARVRLRRRHHRRPRSSGCSFCPPPSRSAAGACSGRSSPATTRTRHPDQTAASGRASGARSLAVRAP